MRYIGSKRRIASSLLQIILDGGGGTYIEPFVGGGNVIAAVPKRYKRIGADINPNAINALRLIRDSPGSLPKNNAEFTVADYTALKSKKTGLTPLEAFAGFAYSYAAKFLGSWATDNSGIDYVRRAYQSAQRQHVGLKGVDLICSPYQDLKIPSGSIIYCDPPYAGTDHGDYQYDGCACFDSAAFWAWCLAQSANNKVYVSEYTAPPGFVSVWSKRVAVTVSLNKYKYAVEKLFVPESQLGEFEHKNLPLFSGIKKPRPLAASAAAT